MSQPTQMQVRVYLKEEQTEKCLGEVINEYLSYLM